ncbi:endolytic transglycosylase MltG [Candidatus Microgenomates bacterium]|nr:MAG: endolytic transglycosylase MltG [Candidatus Microgenomates bacterium]
MLKIFIFLFILISIPLIIVWLLLGPVGSSNKLQVFIVPEDEEIFIVVDSLFEQKLIKNKEAFQFLLNNFAKDKEIKSGGYKLSQEMNAWQILSKITGKQDLLWLTISSCLRKEQIGEKLTDKLGWDKEELNKWNTIYTNTKPEYFEGVYYPDTYLLPIDESGKEIAQRFINRFNEKFAPLADKYVQKNIRWTTGLKIASLIAREAAGLSDMKLVSGIIWNRLDKEMPLQIDATMQYTLGKNSKGNWWGPVDISEKQSDSPYNSYLNKGLPPTPICSPNINYIEAALNPEETDCLFYLHDKYREIHCAKTYKEHLANIEKYLK